VAGILRVFDEGTVPARLFGTIDVFGLWWMWLLSAGLAASCRTAGPAIYMAATGRLVGVAAIVAVVFAVLGQGSI
jgi:hypothetical protein